MEKVEEQLRGASALMFQLQQGLLVEQQQPHQHQTPETLGSTIPFAVTAAVPSKLPDEPPPETAFQKMPEGGGHGGLEMGASNNVRMGTAEGWVGVGVGVGVGGFGMGMMRGDVLPREGCSIQSGGEARVATTGDTAMENAASPPGLWVSPPEIDVLEHMCQQVQ